MPADSNLGPLPRVDANAQLQEKSIRALNALLKPLALFLLRDERYQDYGVDASLELIVGGQPQTFGHRCKFALSARLPASQMVRSQRVST